MGQSPIYEPGLEDLLRKNRDRITATTDLQTAVGSTDITFAAVGTSPLEDGAIDLAYVLTACEEIGRAIKDKDDFHTIIIKSTAFPEIIVNFPEYHDFRFYLEELIIIGSPQQHRP